MQKAFARCRCAHIHTRIASSTQGQPSLPETGLSLDFLRPAFARPYAAVGTATVAHRAIRQSSSQASTSSASTDTAVPTARSSKASPRPAKARQQRAPSSRGWDHPPPQLSFAQQIGRLDRTIRPTSALPDHLRRIFDDPSHTSETAERLRKERNKAVRAIHAGLETRDWDKAFHHGWRALSAPAETGQGGVEALDSKTVEGMVKLVLTLKQEKVAEDWDDIVQLLFHHALEREVREEIGKDSALSLWLWEQFVEGKVGQGQARLERVLDFWGRITSRPAPDKEIDSTGNGLIPLPSLPRSLFEGFAVAHALSPTSRLADFIASYTKHFSVPETFNIMRANEETSQKLRLVRRRLSEHDQTRITHWFEQLELARAWARIGQLGLGLSCKRWRDRQNVQAVESTWERIRDGVRPAAGLENDAWWSTEEWNQTYEKPRHPSIEPAERLTDPNPSDSHTSSSANVTLDERRSESAISDVMNELAGTDILPEPVQPVTLERPVPPAYLTPKLVRDFLHTFLYLGMNEAAQAAWTYVVEDLGLAPPVEMWTGLLLGYSHQRDPAAVERTFATMQSSGLLCDGVVWSIVINSHFRAGQIEDGLARAGDLLQNRAVKALYPNHQLPVRIYNVIINALLWNDSPSAAMEFLESMKKEGVAIDVYTLNILLRYHSRAKSHNLQGISETLRLLQEHPDVRPDIVTFSTVLDALLRAGKTDAIARIQEIMESMNVKMNQVAMGAMIDHLLKNSVRSGEESGMRAALTLFRRMQGDRGQTEDEEPDTTGGRSLVPLSAERGSIGRPTEITYTSLIQGMARFAISHDRKLFFSAAEGLYREMKAYHIPPNRITYNSLMHAALMFDETDKALQYFEQYRKLKTRKRMVAQSPAMPGSSTRLQEKGNLISEEISSPKIWQSLLAGLVEKKLWIVAQQVLDEMRDAGIMPRSKSMLALQEKVRRRGN